MKDNTELQEELSNRLEEIELHFAHWMGRISLLGLVLLPLVPGSLALASIVSKFPDQFKEIKDAQQEQRDRDLFQYL